MSEKHTTHEMVFVPGNYQGCGWMIARVDFGYWEDRRVQGYIVTDGVRASDFDPGPPEADLQLWMNAHKLLAALLDVRDFLRHSGYDMRIVDDAIRAATEPTR